MHHSTIGIRAPKAEGKYRCASVLLEVVGEARVTGPVFPDKTALACADLGVWGGKAMPRGQSRGAESRLGRKLGEDVAAVTTCSSTASGCCKFQGRPYEE